MLDYVDIALKLFFVASYFDQFIEVLFIDTQLGSQDSLLLRAFSCVNKGAYSSNNSLSFNINKVFFVQILEKILPCTWVYYTGAKNDFLKSQNIIH